MSKGHISFSSHEGTVDLKAGDMALRSANSAFDAHSEQFEMLALGLPSETLRLVNLKRTRDTHKLAGDSTLSACLQALPHRTFNRAFAARYGVTPSAARNTSAGARMT